MSKNSASYTNCQEYHQLLGELDWAVSAPVIFIRLFYFQTTPSRLVLPSRIVPIAQIPALRVHDLSDCMVREQTQHLKPVVQSCHIAAAIAHDHRHPNHHHVS